MTFGHINVPAVMVESRAVAFNIEAMAFNTKAVAFNTEAMAFNTKAMAFTSKAATNGSSTLKINKTWCFFPKLGGLYVK